MSNAGNDDAVGSTTAPWASLNKANATMAAGDTLYVRAGTYSGVSSITWSKSGTADDPVVVSAYPGEHPLFNGNGADWLLLVASQYTVIAGLEVTNYESWAVQVGNGSDNVTVRDCYFHNILAVENAAVVTRECSNVTIENCVFEEMGRSLDQLKFDHALYNSDGSHDVTIRNNYFKNNYGGPAINNYHTPAPYNIYIYNNVFVMTEGAERSGIYAGTDGHDVDVYNNTFYVDGTGATTVYGVDLSSGAGTDVAENNIFYFANSNVQEAVVGAAGNTVDYNLYFPAKDSDDTGAHSFASDPLFQSTGSDFHLTALSPARKKGITISTFDDDADGTPRPAGAWDIGAFQYGVCAADAAADAALEAAADATADAEEIGEVSASGSTEPLDAYASTAEAAAVEASSGMVTPGAAAPADGSVEKGSNASAAVPVAGQRGCRCTSVPSDSHSFPWTLPLLAVVFGSRRVVRYRQLRQDGPAH